MTVFKGTIQGSKTIYNGDTYVTGTVAIAETLRGSVDAAGNASFTYAASGSASAVAHYPNGATSTYTYPVNYGGPLVTNINSFRQSLGTGSGLGITLLGHTVQGPYGATDRIDIAGVVPFGYYPNGYPSGLFMSGSLTAYGGTMSMDRYIPAVTRPTTGPVDLTLTVNRYGYTADTDHVSWSVIAAASPYSSYLNTGAVLATKADFVGITLPSGTIDFAAGQTSAQVTVHVAARPALAATSEFAVVLGAPSPGVRFQSGLAYGTIVSATTLAPGAVYVAGAGTDIVALHFPDTARAAPALALAAGLNSSIFVGDVQPVSLAPGDPLPALPGGAQGALALHQGGGTIALGTGYTSLTTDALTPQTVLGGPTDGQLVMADAGGLAFNAGAGAGTVIAAGGNNLVSMYPGAGGQNVQLGDGDDTVVALGGSNTIFAGAGRNVLLLGGGTNSVTTAGSDLIAEAGAGNAVIVVSGPAVAAFLADGTTQIDAAPAQATVVAGNGDAWVQVGAGSQVWLAGGNATVQENIYDFAAGAMTVIGGAGNASVNLRGPGDLVFAGSGATTVTDDAISGGGTVIGGTGPLTLHSDYGGLVALSFGQTFFNGNGANTVAAFAGSLTVVGGGGVFLGGPDGHNVMGGSYGTSAVLIGGGDGDVLTAGDAPYYAYGPVQDVLAAGPGAETLTGAGTQIPIGFYAGPGADLMIAGGGPAQMLGGTGSATMVAGSGLGLFAFAEGNAGAVTIEGFNPTLNYLSLIGFPAGEAAAALAGATSSGGSESLLLSDGTHITFQGFTGLSAGNFL